MPSVKKVTLQISLSPGDYSHARLILPHQLEVLAQQADEILLTIDTKPSKGRFGEHWLENKASMDKLLTAVSKKYPLRIVPVDYTGEIKQRVAEFFLGQKNMPDKDFRGGPFYAYFFGLMMAEHPLVFHLDSDIFLGGGSSTWIREAAEVFDTYDDCLIVSPLPGPPHPQELLQGQQVKRRLAEQTFELAGMSTRIFMIDRSKFAKQKISMSRPPARNQVKAFVEGNPSAQLPEILLTEFIAHKGLKRIDMLGHGKGLWSLHPPYRSPAFYAGLPELIRRIVNNDLPAAQRGFYDIIDEVCDWRTAREQLKQNRWWKKLTKWR